MTPPNLPLLKREAFGPYTLLTLGTPTTHVSFVAERSAYVHQVRLKGMDLLFNYPSGEALTGNKGHRNLALLPFPNRLLEGDYTWDSRSLTFEVNKPDTRSALHGFGPGARFELESIDLSTTEATARLRYLHRASDHPDSYPFDVRFDCVLSVDCEHGTAHWQLTATNIGSEDAPVGLGWHPYFLLPGGADAWSLQMPPNEQVVLERAIPTGELAAGQNVEGGTIDTAWDDCFKLTSATEREAVLRGPAGQLSLKQAGDTRYTQLYVPPGAESVAIEPMTCSVNAFQNRQAEVRITPGGSVTTSMQLSWEPVT